MRIGRVGRLLCTVWLIRTFIEFLKIVTTPKNFFFQQSYFSLIVIKTKIIFFFFITRFVYIYKNCF